MPSPMRFEPKKPRTGPSGSPEVNPAPHPPAPPAGLEVFLSLPGLNLSPEKMEPLAALLRKKGHAVVQCFGRGYFGAPAQPGQKLYPSVWLEGLDRCYEEATGLYPGAALSLLGYSMGALLGVAWSLSRDRPLRRAVFFSPAFVLKWYGRGSLRVAGRLLAGHRILRSRSPAAYRLQAGTSVAAYQGLLQLGQLFRRQLARRDEEGLRAFLPRQFIAFAARDELISTRFLPAYRRRFDGLVALHRLNHVPRAGYPYHLGLDAHTLGERQWELVCGAMEGWLDETAPRGTAAAAPPGARQ